MTHTAPHQPAGYGFEAATNKNRTVAMIAAAMLAVLAILLGIMFLLYRNTAPTVPAPADQIEGTSPEFLPAPPADNPAR